MVCIASRFGIGPTPCKCRTSIADVNTDTNQNFLLRWTCCRVQDRIWTELGVPIQVYAIHCLSQFRAAVLIKKELLVCHPSSIHFFLVGIFHRHNQFYKRSRFQVMGRTCRSLNSVINSYKFNTYKSKALILIPQDSRRCQHEYRYLNRCGQRDYWSCSAFSDQGLSRIIQPDCAL